MCCILMFCFHRSWLPLIRILVIFRARRFCSRFAARGALRRSRKRTRCGACAGSGGARPPSTSSSAARYAPSAVPGRRKRKHFSVCSCIPSCRWSWEYGLFATGLFSTGSPKTGLCAEHFSDSYLNKLFAQDKIMYWVTIVIIIYSIYWVFAFSNYPRMFNWFWGPEALNGRLISRGRLIDFGVIGLLADACLFA